jgi:putative ABC transport system permease protein
MNAHIEIIPFARLALVFLPVLAVLAILYRWSVGGGVALHAIGRMVLQLLMVGYVLAYLFEADRAAIVLAVLSVMILAATWIALRPLRSRRRVQYLHVLLSICAGGIVTLALVTQVVLHPGAWFEPRVVIPLAGMIFASSMNAVSLAAERYEAEVDRHGAAYREARRTALRAALIPVMNSLFAAGLVSLPGMMTGQVLSGVSPLTAVRYQIMVMAMILGSAGLCSACYLTLQRPRAPAAAD